MRQPLTELPLGQEGGGMRIAGVPDWGGQAVKYLELPAGTDFGPMLEGLPGDMCPARHWGHVIEGVIEVRYVDGTEETIQAGDLFYMPPGHTAKVLDDVKFVEFSPADESAEVDEHLQAKMG